METFDRTALVASLCSLGCSLALAAGCGGPPAPAAPAPASSAAPSASANAADATPKAAACIPAAKADRPLAHVSLAGDELTICVGGKGEPSAECLAVMPLTGKVNRAPAWARTGTGALPAAASPGEQKSPYEVKATANDVAICKLGSADCKILKPGYAALPGVGWGEDAQAAQASKTGATTFTRKLVAAANADGSKVFVLSAEAPKKTSASWNVFGDTFDVQTGKRLSHVQLAGGAGSSNALTDPADKWQVAWLGDRLWLAGMDPKSGATTQEFLDPSAGTTLDLGDPSFLLAVGNAWLVGTQKGSQGLVKIVEPRSLANLGKYPLPNAPTAPGDGLPSYAVARGDGTAWVAFANPPGVVMIDVAKHAASAPMMLPLCH